MQVIEEEETVPESIADDALLAPMSILDLDDDEEEEEEKNNDDPIV